MLVRMLWQTLALASLLTGAIGVLLPGLPTVPFLILSAWAAGNGWPQLEQWLLAHPQYGPSIHGWRQQRAIPRRAKWAATVMMSFSLLLIFIIPTPVLLRWLLPPFLLVAALWIWSRPDA